jgi:hypothetical protein
LFIVAYFAQLLAPSQTTIKPALFWFNLTLDELKQLSPWASSHDNVQTRHRHRKLYDAMMDTINLREKTHSWGSLELLRNPQWEDIIFKVGSVHMKRYNVNIHKLGSP